MIHFTKFSTRGRQITFFCLSYIKLQNYVGGLPEETGRKQEMIFGTVNQHLYLCQDPFSNDLTVLNCFRLFL